MHKGLYWTQLILGIGVGLIIASLVWIFAPGTEVVTFDSEHDFSYYDSSKFQLSGQDFQQLHVSSALPSTAPNPEETTALDAPLTPQVKGTAGQSNTDSIADKSPAKEGESLSSPGKPAITATGSNTPSQGTNQAVNASNSAKPSTAKPQFQPGKDDIIEFVITPGESTERIAAQLEALGFFHRKDFLQKMYLTHLDRQIKAKRHLLRKGSTIEEVILTLIK